MAKEKTTISEYRKLDITKLKKDLAEIKLKLQDLRNQLTIGKLKNHQEIRKARHSIAQMETVLNEKIILEAISHGKN